MANFSDYLNKVGFSDNAEALLEAKKKKMIKPVEKLVPGDRLYTGTKNAAEKMGVPTRSYRTFFLNVKNGLLKKGYEAGRAIAIAYYQTNRHFSK